MAGRVGKMGFDGSGAMGGDGDRNGGPRREPDHHGPRRTGPRAHRLREVTVCVCVSLSSCSCWVRRVSDCHSRLFETEIKQSHADDPESESISRSVVSESLRPPWTVTPPGSSVRQIAQARTLERVVIPFPQRIFPAQGSNLGLPRCRRILYTE